jgi:hypothetical protein
MKIKVPISVAIAISFGLVVLLGYFVRFPIFITLRQVFVSWAMMLAAVALIVGVANLFMVHQRKASSGKQGVPYSIILLVSLVITLVIGGVYGPNGTWTLWIFNYIQIPIETSLMAILAVILAYGAARLIGRRLNWFTVLFIAIALIMLLGTATLFGVQVPGLHGPDGLRSLIARIPAVAGGRGILLGVALGAIAAGLRVLMGADRPYGG